MPPHEIAGYPREQFLGGDLNYRCNFRQSDCGRLDGLFGYRFLHLGDSVDIWNSGPPIVDVPGLPAPIPVVGADSSILIHDSIRTRNNFHGGQVGLVGTRSFGGGLFVEGLVKVALGVTVSRANADGTTQFGTAWAGVPLRCSGCWSPARHRVGAFPARPASSPGSRRRSGPRAAGRGRSTPADPPRRGGNAGRWSRWWLSAGTPNSERTRAGPRRNAGSATSAWRDRSCDIESCRLLAGPVASWLGSSRASPT